MYLKCVEKFSQSLASVNECMKDRPSCFQLLWWQHWEERRRIGQFGHHESGLTRSFSRSDTADFQNTMQDTSIFICHWRLTVTRSTLSSPETNFIYLAHLCVSLCIERACRWTWIVLSQLSFCTWVNDYFRLLGPICATRPQGCI